MRLGFVLLAAAAAAFPPVAGAIPILPDTFEDLTTDNWFAGGLGMGQTPPTPPSVVPAGGPQGQDDAYLRVTSEGGSGPGSKLVAINVAQWTGNLTVIPGIWIDLVNLGPNPLSIRLLAENPKGGPPTDEAISTNPVVLEPGSGWTTAFFSTNPTDFTALAGSATTALSDATLLRIVHSTAAADPDPVAGVLGIDNITAVPEASTSLLMLTGLGAVWFWRRRA